MIDSRVTLAALTVLASFEALPNRAAIKQLKIDAENAGRRGYFDPVEDERVRETYTRYLAIRSAIWQVIQELKPVYKTFKSSGELSKLELQAFGVAFAGAEIIVRTGEYLIGAARENDIIWRKLDEAELRYGLKRKSFTRLYRQLTSVFKMSGFYRARDFYDGHKDQIHAALDDTELATIKPILTELNLPTASRGEHLRRYRRFLNFSLRRRRLSAQRNVIFTLFEGTGEDVAELRIPFVKAQHAAKRVTSDVVEQLKPDLRPGDVIITRHDDAMSNLFLPGFWPHGAFYIGSAEERDALGVKVFKDGQRTSSEPDINILESKKDGVLLREIEDTLTVDAFVVLRPRLKDVHIKLALERGLSHAGKLYDFIFDFSTSDRLVCTEVVYRAYHGIGDIDFELAVKAGRNCLSAEDFLNQAIGNGWFEPAIIYGVGGNVRHDGDAAKAILRDSFEATF